MAEDPSDPTDVGLEDLDSRKPAPDETPPRTPRRPVKRAKAQPMAKPQPVAKPVKAKPAKPTPVKPAEPFKAALKGAIDQHTQRQPIHRMHKGKIMDMTSSYTDGFKDIIAEAQEKAKEALAKGNSLFGDANEFARGNVEAVVESGKVLAAGLQEIGTLLVAESRSVFETLTADLKALAAAKSPTEFLKLQTELLRKNFDTAVEYGSKNSEAMVKLANEVMAPIAGRVTVAVDKVRPNE